MLQARPFSRGRLRGVAAILLLLAMLLFHASLMISWRGGVWNGYTFDSVATQGRRGWDFYAVYQAGHACSLGESIYRLDDADIVVPWVTPYRYLPLTACTLGAWMNRLAPRDALVLWVSLEEVVLLACAWTAWRMGQSLGHKVVLAGMWLVFTPLFLESYLGQFSIVQAALILALLRRPSGRAFGPLWAASLVWKQMTGLYLPVLLRERRWRAMGLAGAAVAASAAPYFLRHPQDMPLFARNLYAGAPGAQLGNHGARQLLYSVAAALTPRLSAAGHLWLQGLWVAGVLGITLGLTLRHKGDLVTILCLWTVTFFLVYHDIWEHHYVLLLPVFTVLYARQPRGRLLALYLPLALWTPYRLIDPAGLAAYHMPMRWTPLEPAWLNIGYHAVKALPVLLLWGMLARSLARETVREDLLAEAHALGRGAEAVA